MGQHELLEQAYAHHRAGRFEQAKAIYDRVLAEEPANADALHNLGMLLFRTGELVQSLQLLERSVHLRPNAPAFWSNLGTVCRSIGRGELAASAHANALRLDPNRPESHYNYGNFLQDQGWIDRAIECFRTALRLRPDYWLAELNLGRMLKDQARLDEAITCYRRVIAHGPDPVAIHAFDNLLHLLTLHPQFHPRELLNEHRAWVARFAGTSTLTHSNLPDPVRRIRLAYIGESLREHPVGAMIEPIITRHDRTKFDVFCYANVPQPDALSERLRKSCDHWKPIQLLSHEAVASLVREDGIDVLVDLTSHLAANSLPVFSRKPAPVQISYLAYPATTGLPTMDFAITDRHLDPPGSGDELYVEKLLRLPGSYWCDRVRDEPHEPGPLPALRNGFVTFGCLNNFHKVNTAVLQTWAKILSAVPDSMLTILLRGGEANNRSVPAMFTDCGIDWSRVITLDRAPREQYMSRFQEIDIALDTWPYNGHTTTLDALWMGVPTVTLAGKWAVARGGVSILTNVGLESWIAESTDHYVELTKLFSSDLKSLSELRSGLRARMQQTSLRQTDARTRDLEALYRKAWSDWCAGK